MDKADADAALEQLLEVLDERYEAGPTTYVVEQATVAATETGHALRLVFRRTAGGPLLGWHQQDLTAIGDGSSAVTPEQLGWDIYRVVLEGGAGAMPADPDAAGIFWLTPADITR